MMIMENSKIFDGADDGDDDGDVGDDGDDDDADGGGAGVNCLRGRFYRQLCSPSWCSKFQGPQAATLNGRRGRNESVSATGCNSFCAEKKIPSRPKLWNKDKVSGGK